MGVIGNLQKKVTNAKGPRIWDVQIPRVMRKWATSLTALSGALVDGQEMVNHFAIEPARGISDAPTYTHFVAGSLYEDLWIPAGPAFARPRETWERQQTTHKRPTGHPIPPRLLVVNYLLFVLDGEIDGA